jgi:hypothetical protein
MACFGVPNSGPQMKKALENSRAYLFRRTGAFGPVTSNHGDRNLANLGLPQLGPFDVGTGAA